MKYSWRVDPPTGLVFVRTDGGEEWLPKTEYYATACTRVDAMWRATVIPIAAKHGLSEDGILAMIKQESDGRPKAYRLEKSGATGIGLLQITDPGLKGHHTDEQLYDPRLNIEIGTAYAAELARRYHTADGLPDWPRVFAAFNAGSARPDPKSPWNLMCTGPHVDNEVRFLNTIIMARMNATQVAALEAFSHQFDLEAALDLTPHHEEHDTKPAPEPDFEEQDIA
jgi:hypothetical protein